MKKLTTLMLTSLAVMAMAVSCKNKNPEQRAQKIVKRISKKLELNQQQQVKLNQLKDKMLRIHKEKQNNKENFHKEVKSLLTQKRISQEQIKSLLDRKRNHIDHVLPEVLPEFIDFHASLEQSQKEKLVKFLERFTKRRRGKRKHH